MKYNVAGLLAEHVGSTREHVIENERIEAGYATFEGINGRVEMLRTDRTVLVTARLSAVSELECARCLEPVRTEIGAALEEEFLPANLDLVGHYRDASWDEGPVDSALLISEKNILDMSEAVRQALTGSIPMAPLCSESCRGLCPGCLVNLNHTTCVCPESPTTTGPVDIEEPVTRRGQLRG